MEASPLSPDPGRWSGNLEALRAVDPALADRLTALDLSPRSPHASRTRDGQISFRLRNPDGSHTWLGQTSIPTVRAAALLESFDAGQGHVLLPGLGEGTEAHLLLQRLPATQTVFVWESDALAVRLALSLRDYAAALRANRLVLLVCPLEDLTDALVQWLMEHPTVACPARMLRWPWQTHAEIAEARSAVEAAWAESQRRRATKTGA